jgi:hypothetical protein
MVALSPSIPQLLGQSLSCSGRIGLHAGKSGGSVACRARGTANRGDRISQRGRDRTYRDCSRARLPDELAVTLVLRSLAQAELPGCRTLVEVRHRCGRGAGTDVRRVRRAGGPGFWHRQVPAGSLRHLRAQALALAMPRARLVQSFSITRCGVVGCRGRVHADDELSACTSGFEVPHGVGHLAERVGLLDRRQQLAVLDEFG